MYPDNQEELIEEVAQKYEDYHNPGLAKMLKFAGLGVEWTAEGCYIYDADGNPYLDCLGGYGVFSLGHRHPKVVEAVKAQLEKMPLASKLFFNKPLADLCEKLAEVAPGDLQYSFLCNSGTEAVEGALKIARKATGRRKFVSTKGGFHGKTMGALSATGRAKFKDAFLPLIEEFVHVPYDDIAAMQEVIDDDTAGVIIEPIQGEGGIIIPSDNYLIDLRQICTDKGALLIVDEVQTGLGRTGAMFAVNHYGVNPDIMTLAKALGGGVIPTGAFMATPDIWEKGFGDNPLVHTSTFGGNPLACQAALATIRVIQEEGLIENAKARGQQMLEGLKQVQQRHSQTLCSVRGRGLMIGVEFVQDDVGELVIAGLVKRGVIAAYTLNNPRVMRFEPPLIINEMQVNHAVNIFDEAVAETVEILASLE
jgi:putrescine aminotransferase